MRVRLFKKIHLYLPEFECRGMHVYDGMIVDLLKVNACMHVCVCVCVCVCACACVRARVSVQEYTVT